MLAGRPASGSRFRSASCERAILVRVIDYLDVLKDLHQTLRPGVYLEIGVAHGDSLAVAGEDTFCIGVDPEPCLPARIASSCVIEASTSDDFFAGNRPRELLGGRRIDLAFIDGLHLFEYALRDYMAVEALSGEDSLIAIHDVLPRDEVTAARVRTTDFWTGDVWKLLPCLLDCRPDLEITLIDSPPSGLALVRRLSPQDGTLAARYQEILERYGSLEFSDWERLGPQLTACLSASPEAQAWTLRRRIETLSQEVDLLESQLAAVHDSTSWRMTRPVRALGGWLGRAAGRFRAER